jgi:hypothetical protein
MFRIPGVTGISIRGNALKWGRDEIDSILRDCAGCAL